MTFRQQFPEIAEFILFFLSMVMGMAWGIMIGATLQRCSDKLANRVVDWIGRVVLRIRPERNQR